MINLELHFEGGIDRQYNQACLAHLKNFGINKNWHTPRVKVMQETPLLSISCIARNNNSLIVESFVDMYSRIHLYKKQGIEVYLVEGGAVLEVPANIPADAAMVMLSTFRILNEQLLGSTSYFTKWYNRLCTSKYLEANPFLFFYMLENFEVGVDRVHRSFQAHTSANLTLTVAQVRRCNSGKGVFGKQSKYCDDLKYELPWTSALELNCGYSPNSPNFAKLVKDSLIGVSVQHEDFIPKLEAVIIKILEEN